MKHGKKGLLLLVAIMLIISIFPLGVMASNEIKDEVQEGELESQLQEIDEDAFIVETDLEEIRPSKSISRVSEELHDWELSYIADFVGKELSDIVNPEVIYNAEENPAYIMVSFSSGGYAIYNREIRVVLEYATDGDETPFEHIEGNGYYSGPLNYLYKEDEQFRSVMNDEVVTAEEAVEVEEVILEALQENLEDAPTARSAQAQSTVSEEQYIIRNADALRGMDFGINETGSCGRISASILLRYHNRYKHSQIAPSSLYPFRSGTTKTQHETDPLHDNLMENYDFGIYNDGGSDWLQDARTINYFLGDNDHSRDLGYRAVNTLSGVTIRNVLRNDIPVSVSTMPGGILTAPHEVGDPSVTFEQHTLVAYGYRKVEQSGKELNYYNVHSGWHWKCDDSTNTQREIWMTGEVFSFTYMDYVGEHEHQWLEFITNNDRNKELYRCALCNLIISGEDAIEIEAEKTYTGTVNPDKTTWYQFEPTAIQNFAYFYGATGNYVLKSSGANVHVYDTDKNGVTFTSRDNGDRVYQLSNTQTYLIAVSGSTTSNYSFILNRGEDFGLLEQGETVRYGGTLLPSASNSYKFVAGKTGKYDFTTFVGDGMKTYGFLFEIYKDGEFFPVGMSKVYPTGTKVSSVDLVEGQEYYVLITGYPTINYSFEITYDTLSGGGIVEG